MWIRYIIPEDGDSLQHPNVFKLDITKEPTLFDIEQSFPIPGKYNFRFLKNVENFTVWSDPMEGDRLPLYQGAVVVKANRAPGGPELAEVSQPVNTTRPLINITDEVLLAPKVETNPIFPDDDLLGFTSSNSAPSAKASNQQNELFGLETLQPTLGLSNRNPPLASSVPLQQAPSGFAQNNKNYPAPNSANFQQFTPLNNQRQPTGGGQIPYSAQSGNRGNIPPKRF